MITQTPFGRFLCWLGVHAIITQHIGANAHGEGHASAWGGCVRCNRGWQWD
jgi:hypothetical protein